MIYIVYKSIYIMVRICDKPYDSSNSKYNTHFELFPYPLSDFQKYAIEAIVEGQHVLVTAPTGSGKTLPAEFAIQYFHSLGKKLIYCSPIKALSNQKYHEFTKKYPHISFGIQTGDCKCNGDADVIIMTTEILMNYLFTLRNAIVDNGTNNRTSTNVSKLDFNVDINTELACVVFDEVHYINDAERGNVWEKSILMLPPHVQMCMLSATIDNPEGFAKWCERGEGCNSSVDKIVYLATTSHRIVPLSHYGFLTTTEGLFKAIKDKDLEKSVRDKTNCLIPLQSAGGKFNDSGYRSITQINKLFETHQIDSKRKHVLNQISLYLRDHKMLPAIAFVFSRKQVELCASEITVPLLEDDSKVGYNVKRECEQIVRKLPNFHEYLELPEYIQLVGLLEKGIGIHHSGMIPILREIVELMISKRYIKLLFATESFAIGLDCPIKTAIFTSLRKFDGRNERYLMSHEYTQMAGRAGRRGIDTVGHVVHCNNLFDLPTLPDYQSILGGVPQKLVSKFNISYGLILNLLKNGAIHNDTICEFSNKSMIQFELEYYKKSQTATIMELNAKIDKKRETIKLLFTPESVCDLYFKLEASCKMAVNKKRREAEKEMRKIEDENITVKQDIKYVAELKQLLADLAAERNGLNYTNTYISLQTQRICNIMMENGFIYEKEPSIFEMTSLGNISSCIAEIHPLIMSHFFVKWDYFAAFSPRQIIGLFSCFTNVKVPDQEKISIPSINDTFLKSRIEEVVEMYTKYGDYERADDVRTGINYDDALIFDIIEFSMKWTDCSNELDCKVFIQNNMSISIGDFTKAMLKIVTISNEWMKVCEMLGQIEALHKLSQIEGLVLKYVATSQSLYI